MIAVAVLSLLTQDADGEAHQLGLGAGRRFAIDGVVIRPVAAGLALVGRLALSPAGASRAASKDDFPPMPEEEQLGMEGPATASASDMSSTTVPPRSAKPRVITVRQRWPSWP